MAVKKYFIGLRASNGVSDSSETVDIRAFEPFSKNPFGIMGTMKSGSHRRAWPSDPRGSLTSRTKRSEMLHPGG